MNQQKHGRPILVVGSLNMDLVASAAHLPQRGETVHGDSFATYPGGKGANQAAAAGKLGAFVRMAGCVGSDDFGAELKRSLAEDSNVDASCVRTVPGATGTALITVETSGANTIVVIAGANRAAGYEDVDAGLAACDEPGILLVQHEIPEEAVHYAIRKAKAAGWTVILNPAPVREIPPDILALVDLLTPNETEAAALTGMHIASPEDAEAAARKLLDAGVKEVVITLGEAGALWLTKDEKYLATAHRVKAVDTTAAGDTYTAAIAAALAEGRDMRQALKSASLAAALAVTRQGAQSSMPTREEVAAFAATLKLDLEGPL